MKIREKIFMTEKKRVAAPSFHPPIVSKVAGCVKGLRQNSALKHFIMSTLNSHPRVSYRTPVSIPAASAIVRRSS
jgi:hypothetical protein